MNTATAEPDAGLSGANDRFVESLAALNGCLRKGFGGLADPSARGAVGVFSSRIRALEKARRRAGKPLSEAWIDAPAHLGRLCAELCAAHLAPRGLYCEFRADPGMLPRETCQTLGLIVSDLVTHEARRAFIGRPWGRISVCLRRAAQGWVCLVAHNGSDRREPGEDDGMAGVRELAEALGGDLRIHSDAGGVMVILSLQHGPFVRSEQAGVRPCRA
jgi:two-component sensor histidine kinase